VSKVVLKAVMTVAWMVLLKVDLWVELKVVLKAGKMVY
jgi:hypothetical protein